MNLNDLHRRLLQDVLEIGNAFPLVLTGGYAIQAHHIVNRFSRDIDMATNSAVTMEAIVTTVVGGLTGRGWRVAGGASTVRQALRANVIDDLVLDIVPVTLGNGECLLDNVPGLNFEPVEVAHSPHATHISFLRR
jgi:dihydrofolate reductase